MRENPGLLLLVWLVYIKRCSRIKQVVRGTPGVFLLIGLVYIKGCSRIIQVVRGNSSPTPSTLTDIYQEV